MSFDRQVQVFLEPGITCKNCGQCCHLLVNDEPSKIPCKHLLRQSDDTTRCNIYTNRLSTPLDSWNRCILRKDSEFDYEGCPYNTGDKPVYRTNEIEAKRIK